MRPLPIAIAAALTLLLVAACKSSSSDDATPTPSASGEATDTAAPAATPSPTPDPEADFPELTPFPPALEAQLHAIRDRVSEIRGLPVHPTAKEGTVTSEALADYDRDQFDALEDEDAEDIEVSEALLKLLGLVPPDFTVQAYVEDQAGLFEGLYYFEADRLVLVGDAPQELSINEELTMAHEYTHSLQDARHDLSTLTDRWVESEEEEDGYTSYSETLECLIEGDAEVTQALYAESVYGPNWEDLTAADYADDPPIDFSVFPEYLLNDLYFDYVDCVTFVQALYDDGGWDAVNAAYEDPPGTTEQIIIIDKYYDGELAGQPKPESIDGQLNNWSEDEDFAGQFGFYDVYNYIGSRSGDYDAAALAALGWDYGWSRTFLPDGDAGGVAADVTLGWDTYADRFEFMQAFTGVLESHLLGPDDIATTAETRRWIARDDSGQHGALIMHDSEPALRIVYAPDEAALNTLINVQ